MVHHTIKSGYVQLVDRLNRFPQGATPSKLLYKILEMLFSKKEAKLLSLLPLRPFSAEKAAHLWKMEGVRTRKTLDQLCGRAIDGKTIILRIHHLTLQPNWISLAVTRANHQNFKDA